MDKLQLNDIKPIVDIPDNSIYFFWGLIGLGVVLGLIGLWILIRYLRRERAQDLQKLYLQKLKEISLDESKEAAYALTYYGHLLEKDHPQGEAYRVMMEYLEAFKYKKSVKPFDPATKSKIEIFLEVIHA